MKPRIMFGLIFGLLGMLLNIYASVLIWTLCGCQPIIFLAGGAGLLTGSRERAQTRVAGGKAGAVAGAITGILIFVGQFLGMILTAAIQSSSPAEIPTVIISMLLLGGLSMLLAAGVGAAAAYITTPTSQPLMKSVGEQGKKYRLTLITGLIAGVIAAVLTYFMMPGIVSLLSQSGIFNTWSTIKSPPSGVAKILGVTDGAYKQFDDVWIETHDGQIFSTAVCTGYSQPCTDHPEWRSTSKTPVYFDKYTSGTDCKKLGDYPLNPSGQIVECRHYLFVENVLSTIMYYALMADGSLNYFVMDFRMQIAVLFKFILATVLIYFMMLIFVFRLTNYLAKQIQIRRENASGQLSD